MEKIELERVKSFKGEISPPPDKSISHRAVIFSSLSEGRSIIRNFLRADDPLSTIRVFRTMGVVIEERGGDICIEGKGLHGLEEPGDILDCGNSGTTIRLVSGVVAGNSFFSVLNGDDSLRTRPMKRIVEPLTQMGAEIRGRDGNKYPPLAVTGKKLKPIQYVLPVASAQVKSSILLAGLYADGQTEISEPSKSRDHTERMLPAFGARINTEGLRVCITGGIPLKGREIEIPGDFSSAAFFIVASLLISDADITIRGVGINPTRTGLLNALRAMGAEIDVQNMRTVSGEPVGDIHCEGKQNLRAIKITREQVPSLLDEFPILCVAAAQAEGTTVIGGAEELRVKESDRISSMATELRKMGVQIEEYPDGLSIVGTEHLIGSELQSHGDHRIAMALSIAALVAEGTTIIHGISSVQISFPDFFGLLREQTA